MGSFLTSSLAFFAPYASFFLPSSVFSNFFSEPFFGDFSFFFLPFFGLSVFWQPFFPGFFSAFLSIWTLIFLPVLQNFPRKELSESLTELDFSNLILPLETDSQLNLSGFRPILSV